MSHFEFVMGDMSRIVRPQSTHKLFEMARMPEKNNNDKIAIREHIYRER